MESGIQLFVILRGRCRIYGKIGLDDGGVHEESPSRVEVFFQRQVPEEFVSANRISFGIHEMPFEHVRRRQPFFEHLRGDFDEIRLAMEAGVLRKFGIVRQKMHDVSEFVEKRSRRFDREVSKLRIGAVKIATDGTNRQYELLFSAVFTQDFRKLFKQPS